jgi:hypothetical protein
MTFAEDAKLDGTWTTKKTGPDGNAYTQSIGIKKDKDNWFICFENIFVGSKELLTF